MPIITAFVRVLYGFSTAFIRLYNSVGGECGDYFEDKFCVFEMREGKVRKFVKKGGNSEF